MIETLPWFANLPPELQALARALWYSTIALVLLAAARSALRIAIDFRITLRERSALSAAVAIISLTIAATVAWLAWSVTATVMEALPQ